MGRGEKGAARYLWPLQTPLSLQTPLAAAYLQEQKDQALKFKMTDAFLRQGGFGTHKGVGQSHLKLAGLVDFSPTCIGSLHSLSPQPVALQLKGTTTLSMP